MSNIMQKVLSQRRKAGVTLPLTTGDIETTTRRRCREQRIKNKGGEYFDAFAQAMCIGRCSTVGLLVLCCTMFSFWLHGNVEENILG